MTASDCAISSSWWGNMLSSPPVWMSNRRRGSSSAIAEHSMCQPGKPRPTGSATQLRPSPAAFHSAKSAASRLSGLDLARRWRAQLASELPDSSPYPGNVATEK